MSKRDAPQRPEDQFEDLAAQSREARRGTDEARAAAEAGVKARLATRSALQLAACGTAEKPTGPAADSTRIDIDDRTWAGWILEAARAWRVVPGADALSTRPLPDKGPGIEAGQRIFEMALGGASKKQLEEAIGRARAAVGPWDPSLAISTSEGGILQFFRQLDRYFDGKEWSPPRIRTKGTTPAKEVAMGESPGSLEDARRWLITKPRLVKYLALQGAPWLRDKWRYCDPGPERRAPSKAGFSPRYQLGVLYNAILAAAEGARVRPLKMENSLLMHLERPDSLMPWERERRQKLPRKHPKSSEKHTQSTKARQSPF